MLLKVLLFQLLLFFQEYDFFFIIILVPKNLIYKSNLVQNIFSHDRQTSQGLLLLKLNCSSKTENVKIEI